MKNWICSAIALLLTACASVPREGALAEAADWAQRAGAPAPALALDDAERAALRAERARLLQGELTEAAAVQLALRASPGAQALLAEGWAMQSATAEAATWPRLGLAFERTRQGDEIERAGKLTIGLAELVTLPLRQASAQRRLQWQRVKLAGDLLALHSAVRQQWVRAVAAGQLVAYHQDVLEVAQAGDGLARGLQKAGNFSLLQRSREQAFLADAQAQATRAALQATVEREALARLLGLTADEAATVRWPARLPDLPQATRDRAEVTQAATRERLDIALAQAQWQVATGDERNVALGLLDVEVSVMRTRAGGETAHGREIELSLALPDAAALRRQGAGAAALAAAARIEQARAEAAATVRERHAAYLAAHGLARHFRDEVVPLRKTIADEMLLRYNGMLSSVFALLADARAQVGAVIASIEAQRDFWLASAALDAAILGAPSGAVSLQAAMPAAADAKGGH